MLAVGHGFSWKKKWLLVANMYLHLFQSFPGIKGGSNGWMALDDVPNWEISTNFILVHFIGWASHIGVVNEYIVPKEG